MVNKFIYTVLASALALSMVGCGDNGAAKDTNANKAAPETAAAAAAPEAKETAAPAATDEKDLGKKASIAMGTMISSQINQTVDAMNTYKIALDKKLIKDAFAAANNGKPQMTEDEMKTVLNELQKQLQTKVTEKAKAEAAVNLKQGEEFLAENAKKAGVKTTASGLQYKIEKEGTGAKPSADDTVMVNYKGYTIDNKVFDESKDKPVEVNLKLFIKGWQEAFQLFPVGTKATIYIPAKLAFGEAAPSELIKPNSVLIFDVELTEIKKANSDKAPAAPAKSDKK